MQHRQRVASQRCGGETSRTRAGPPPPPARAPVDARPGEMKAPMPAIGRFISVSFALRAVGLRRRRDVFPAIDLISNVPRVRPR